MRALRLVLAAVIGLLPLAPPEHVHRAEAMDGHDAVVAHRHGEAHNAEPGHDADRHHEELSADDAHLAAATIDSIYIASNTYTSHPPAVVPVRVLEPSMVETPPVPFDFIERLIHGPPRAPSPSRAPPSPAFL